MSSLPAGRRRTLDRIERTLVAEDPVLGLRFALFTRLTLEEDMPGAERVPGRMQRFLLPAVIPPLLVISLLTLLAQAGSCLAAGRDAPQARTGQHAASTR